MKKSLILVSSLFFVNLCAMYKPVDEESIKIIVGSLKKADMHLLLAADANVQDLKEKLAPLTNIPVEKQTIHIVTKFLFFDKQSQAITSIQKLKDIIAHHKTNKFLVRFAPST